MISEKITILLYIDFYRMSFGKVSALPKRTFGEREKSDFLLSLQQVDWSGVDALALSEGPDVAYSAFINQYMILYDKFFPYKTHIKSGKLNTPRQPWMTTALLNSCKRKSKLYKKYLKNPSDLNKSKFTKFRNRFKLVRKECEARYYTERFAQCTNNLSGNCKIVKQLLNSKGDTNLPDAFLNGNTELKDPYAIANAFNDYFINIGPSLANTISPSSNSFANFMPNPPSCSFGLLSKSKYEITTTATTLKTTMSTGVDDIKPSIAMLSIDHIAAPLASIINSSFNSGLVPNALKIAKVIPIYKSGEKNSIANYRPISILPFFSKIMANRLTKYLSDYSLLSSTQYGFQRGLSTYMALLDLQSNISEAMNNNMFSIGVFFDISKAFDTVNHDILLSKLDNFGIRGVVKSWFTDYLNNITQFVLVKGVTSITSRITCGVPQGSILGPLLFLIYLNDLTLISSCLKFILFADDTNVILSHRSITKLFEIMNYELLKVADWFNVNKLVLNSGKTNYILFHSVRKKASSNAILINNKPLKQLESIKLLGVIIDSHLSWKDHITLITNKISKKLGIISRIKHYLPFHVLLNLYYTLIFPYLSYCNIVWGSNYPSYLLPLVILQKRIIRIVCNLPCLASTKTCFFNFNILTLDNRPYKQLPSPVIHVSALQQSISQTRFLSPPYWITNTYSFHKVCAPFEASICPNTGQAIFNHVQWTSTMEQITRVCKQFEVHRFL